MAQPPYAPKRSSARPKVRPVASGRSARGWQVSHAFCACAPARGTVCSGGVRSRPPRAGGTPRSCGNTRRCPRARRRARRRTRGSAQRARPRGSRRRSRQRRGSGAARVARLAFLRETEEARGPLGEHGHVGVRAASRALDLEVPALRREPHEAVVERLRARRAFASGRAPWSPERRSIRPPIASWHSRQAAAMLPNQAPWQFARLPSPTSSGRRACTAASGPGETRARFRTT